MKFVKGSPIDDTNKENSSWYLVVNNDVKTVKFIDEVRNFSIGNKIVDTKTPVHEAKLIMSVHGKSAANLILGLRNGWYMNKVGGMTPTLYNVSDTMESADFPDKLIRISKWTNGSHYFAKAHGQDVVDNDGNVKWDSEELAMAAAIEYMKNL